MSSYEWFCYQPSTPQATVKSDIFALGCAIYEIVTGSPPYHEFKGMDNARGHVERLYEKSQFPDVACLPMGDLMLACWHGKFNSMREVVERKRQFKPPKACLWDIIAWWRIVTAQYR